MARCHAARMPSLREELLLALARSAQPPDTAAADALITELRGLRMPRCAPCHAALCLFMMRCTLRDSTLPQGECVKWTGSASSRQG